jgi:hypothetical protein
MSDWAAYNWKVISSQSGVGLVPTDILHFGNPQGDEIKVENKLPWGNCTYNGTAGTAMYNSQSYVITESPGGDPGTLVLTCKPSSLQPLIRPGSTESRTSAGSGRSPKEWIAGLVAGIVSGTAAGRLLGCSFLASLASATTASLVLWVAQQLSVDEDPVPNTEDPPSVWTAQGGGGGTLPPPETMPA